MQSSYGFHIIHVDDKQAAHVKTLDEVKDQIEESLKQQKAAQAAAESGQCVCSAQARTAGLDKAAAAKGLQVVTTDFVSRTDALPGIGNSPQFMGAVFAQTEKSPPDQVQLPQGYAVFEVEAIKPAATPTFDEIRSRVETEFKNERVAALLSQKTQELADRAKAEHDLKKAAKEAGAVMKTSELVQPDGQVPDIGSMAGGAAVAFTMKPGEISGPISNGNTGVVLSILDRQEPHDQDFAAKKDQIRDGLLQGKQQEIFGLFLTNLRDQMEKSGKIKINQDEMKNLTRRRLRNRASKGGSRSASPFAGSIGMLRPTFTKCYFPAPPAFCCTPRRFLPSVALGISGRRLMSSSIFSRPPVRVCGRCCHWDRPPTEIHRIPRLRLSPATHC